jgi:hypothetical protein
MLGCKLTTCLIVFLAIYPIFILKKRWGSDQNLNKNKEKGVNIIYYIPILYNIDE